MPLQSESAKKNMFGQRITLFYFFFVLGFHAVYAQQQRVTGKVTDDTGALPGVAVYTDENHATTTDANGDYILMLDKGSWTLKAKLLGYGTFQKVILVGENNFVQIHLIPLSKQLQSVVVSAGKFEQKLEEVTVTMETIKPKSFETIGDNNVETALEHVSGLNVNDGQANIRGGSGFSYGAGSRVLVLVDDMPMLSADANDAKWSFLPIENLEQIEIIKGASSALYGSSAMNGVINFRTGYAKSDPVTKIVQYNGIYDSPRRKEIKWWGKETQMLSGANMFHSQKFGQWDFVAGGHYLLDEGFRKGETEKRARVNINTRYRFPKIEGLSAGVNANYMESFGGLFIIWNDDTTGAYIPSGGVDDSTSTLSNYHTVRYNIDPFITYHSKKGFSAKWRSRYFMTLNYNDTDQEAFADLYYSEVQLQQRFEKWSLVLTGGGVITDGGVRSDLYGSRKTYNQALYAQADKKFFDRLNLSFGWRWEQFRFRYGKAESKPVIRAGANLRLLRATYLRSSYGQGYRFPSIAEKYVRTRVGSIVIYPNDSIFSESGWSAEIGLRQLFAAGKRFSGYVDASVFRSQYKNMLEFAFGSYGDPFKDPLFGLGFKSLNIGNTRIDGMEFEMGIQLTILKKLNLQLGGGYTYIDPRLTDFDSTKAATGTVSYNFLKYRYRNLFKGFGSIEYGKVSFSMNCRYNSFMENIDVVFNELLPGVKRYRANHHGGDWVYDANVSYKVNAQMALSIISRNLFNHEYSGIPSQLEAPRMWLFQIVITP